MVELDQLAKQALEFARFVFGQFALLAGFGGGVFVLAFGFGAGLGIVGSCGFGGVLAFDQQQVEIAAAVVDDDL